MRGRLSLLSETTSGTQVAQSFFRAAQADDGGPGFGFRVETDRTEKCPGVRAVSFDWWGVSAERACGRRMGYACRSKGSTRGCVKLKVEINLLIVFEGVFSIVWIDG